MPTRGGQDFIRRNRAPWLHAGQALRGFITCPCFSSPIITESGLPLHYRQILAAPLNTVSSYQICLLLFRRIVTATNVIFQNTISTLRRIVCLLTYMLELYKLVCLVTCPRISFLLLPRFLPKHLKKSIIAPKLQMTTYYGRPTHMGGVTLRLKRLKPPQFVRFPM